MGRIATSFVMLLVLLLGNTFLLGTRVSIQNCLEGKEDLILHCQSKDDDLGEQNVKHLKTFEFEFRPNIFGGTLFYCSFQWPGACNWFDIYNQNEEYKADCDLCTWEIFKYGPCTYVPDSPYYLCYAWKEDTSCI
ncbi:hypothetical protein HN51_067201 [Arachis hypogaea]|nr:uncharacterized protein DS421_4g130700 [Arachis hypogaea]